MNQTVTTIITLIGTTALTSIVTLIVTALYHHIVNNSKKAIEKKDAASKERLKGLFDEFSTPIINKLDENGKTLNKVADGTRNSLKNDILKCYYDCLKKGYRSQNDTDNFRSMFDSYIALGGNSFIRDEIYPLFYEQISFKTAKEIAEIEHDRRTKRDQESAQLQAVVDRGLNCPYYNKKKTVRKRSSKKQILLENKD